MLSSQGQQSAWIKEETMIEPSYSDRFIEIMQTTELENSISKDSVLELVQLFYQNNALFLEYFEKSFLMIFKTHGAEGGKHYKFENNETVKGYSELLNLFLVEMIKMELEVKKTSEEQQYFQNFVDFYLVFFSQALFSAKSFTKQLAFTILGSSLKIIDEHLEFQLLSETQQALLEACLYLLSSKFEDYKKMGIEMYITLKKIKLKSRDIDEILFHYIETLSNFQLRKTIILSAISIQTSEQLDRLMNRLKDKNPLIIEAVIQKLINEKIGLQRLTFNQRTKLLIDGFGSYHSKVKNQSLKYFARQFVECLKVDHIQDQKNLAQKHNLDTSCLQRDEKDKQSRIERFIKIFNYDHSLTLTSHISRTSHFISSELCRILPSLCFYVTPELVQQEIMRIFQKIENSEISLNQTIFLYSLLTSLCESKDFQQPSLNFQRIQIKKFITSATFLPSSQQIIGCLRKGLKQSKKVQKLSIFFNLVKSIKLLVLDLDLYDCVGIQIIYQELKREILEFGFLESSFEEDMSKNKRMSQKFDQQFDCILSEKLRKSSQLIGNGDQSTSSQNLLEISHPIQLIPPIIQMMYGILSREKSSQDFELKLIIDELIQSKALKLERQTIMTMYKKTSKQILNSEQEMNEDMLKKPISNLIAINIEIEKRLALNSKKINSNIVKAFSILAKTLFLKESNKNNKQLISIKASNYLEHIKGYLYKRSDQVDFQKQSDLDYFYLPYVLIYRYCQQSRQNYNFFRKLFSFYAIEQPSSIQNLGIRDELIKLLNMRLLSELEFAYPSINSQQTQQKLQKQENQTLLEILINKLINKTSTNSVQEHFYQQIVLNAIQSPHLSSKDQSYFSKIMMLTLKERFSLQSDQLFIRKFMMKLQQLSGENPNEIYNQILIFYGRFMELLNLKKQKFTNVKRDSFLYEVSKIVFSYLRITSTNEDSSQSDSKGDVTEVLWKFVLTLKLLENYSKSLESSAFISIFRPSTIFPDIFLSNRDAQQEDKRKGLQKIEIQLLIFVKKSVQRFSNYLQSKKQPDSLQIEKSLKFFSSELDQLDELLQQEISRHLYENNIYDQQSTNLPSPQLEENLRKDEKINQAKVDFMKIQFFQKELTSKVIHYQSKSLNIFDDMKETNCFQEIHQNWQQIHIEKNQKYQDLGAPIQLETKLENVSLEPIMSNLNPEMQYLLNVFDKNGRRKDRLQLLKKKQELYESKASIRRLRFIIIPYEIVQKAEIEQKLKAKKIISMKKHKRSQNESNYKPSYAF